MTPKNLKGYSLAQRNLAYAIRDRAISKIDLHTTDGGNLFDRMMKITSPLFFIKYRELLESGQVRQALSDYSDENYQRRASAMSRKK